VSRAIVTAAHQPVEGGEASGWRVESVKDGGSWPWRAWGPLGFYGGQEDSEHEATVAAQAAEELLRGA
jgi:hypothetical protein